MVRVWGWVYMGWVSRDDAHVPGLHSGARLWNRGKRCLRPKAEPKIAPRTHAPTGKVLLKARAPRNPKA